MDKEKFSEKGLKLTFRFLEDMKEAGKECGIEESSVYMSILMSLPLAVRVMLEDEPVDIDGVMRQ